MLTYYCTVLLFYNMGLIKNYGNYHGNLPQYYFITLASGVLLGLRESLLLLLRPRRAD